MVPNDKKTHCREVGERCQCKKQRGGRTQTRASANLGAFQQWKRHVKSGEGGTVAAVTIRGQGSWL